MSDGFGRDIIYEHETRRQLTKDLWRILMYAEDDENLKKMCSRCDKWCGEEHDYNECVDMPCFIFYRAFEYLELVNSYNLL